MLWANGPDLGLDLDLDMDLDMNLDPDMDYFPFIIIRYFPFIIIRYFLFIIIRYLPFIKLRYFPFRIMICTSRLGVSWKTLDAQVSRPSRPVQTPTAGMVLAFGDELD